MPIEFAPPSPNLQGFQIPAPQYEDPLASLAKLGAVRSQNLERQKQQMELDSMRGALRAYSESGGDPDKFEALAPRYGVTPGVVVDFKTKIAGLAEKRAQTALAQTQAERAAAEATDLEHDQLYQAYNKVWDAKPEEQEGLINSANTQLLKQGWDPKKLMHYTTPEDVQMAQDLYTTHKQIQLAGEQKLKAAQQAQAEAQTEKENTETAGLKRQQMIADIRGAELDPKANVPTPAAWAAIQAKYPKAGLPAQPTEQYIAKLAKSTIPEKDIPEYEINQWKAKVGLLGNSEFDQFLWQHARSLGKMPNQLNPDEFNSGLQKYAEIKQDPILRSLAIATKGLQEKQTAAAVSNILKPEDIESFGKKLVDLDISPSQYAQFKTRSDNVWPQILLAAEREAQRRGTTFSQPALEAKFKTWEDTEKRFAGGDKGDQIRSFGNLMEHASMLDDARKALGSNNLPALRGIANALGVATGSNAQTTYDTIAGFVASEAGKAFGSNGAEAERAQTFSHFDRNLGDKQISGNIRALMGLVDSQRKGLEEQYDRGTFGKGQMKGHLFPDRALEARDRLMGKKPAATGGHTIRIGDKLYHYNGSGDTSDLKNYTEVKVQ